MLIMPIIGLICLYGYHMWKALNDPLARAHSTLNLEGTIQLVEQVYAAHPQYTWRVEVILSRQIVTCVALPACLSAMLPLRLTMFCSVLSHGAKWY